MGDINNLPSVPWKESEAKQQLKNDIMCHIVTKDSDPYTVWNSNPLYRQYKKTNFRSNLKNLIIAVDKKEKRAIMDDHAVSCERMLHPRPELTTRGYPFWDTSPASMFLKEDIRHDVHKTMSIEEFWNWREAYKEFPLGIFRKHIQQESSSRLQKTYWLKKKEKKK
jgi:hypothetical protein